MAIAKARGLLGDFMGSRRLTVANEQPNLEAKSSGRMPLSSMYFLSRLFMAKYYTLGVQNATQKVL